MDHVFIIGGQRCGSTYLYEVLDEHPQVEMAKPVRPEPKFFLDAAAVGLGRAHYEQLYFATRTDATRVLGEKSTTYIEHAEVAERIRSFYPDARILVTLRDPVQRAWSNYNFSVKHGLEEMSFRGALAAEADRLATASFETSTNPFAYERRGHYVEYLDPYIEAFGAANLRVVVLEELAGDPTAVRELYGWLGVDDSFVPPTIDAVVNGAARGIDPSDDDRLALRALAEGYERSVQRLETRLGRSFDAWRLQWGRL